MKTNRYFKVLAMSIAVLTFNFSVLSQTKKEDEKVYITITKMHKNLNLKNPSIDKWKAGEKEYLDKVIKKNEFILSREVCTHYLTDDSSEMLFVQTFKTWEDIEKAGKRSSELEKAAWPDEKKRDAFFKDLDQYYDKKHSDEIYVSIPGMKEDAGLAGKSVFYHMRISHFAFPENGSEKEFMELSDEFNKAVMYKNPHVKAFYPFVHAWGSDKRQFVEVIATESLADLEKAFEKMDELYKANWKDEAKRKAFEDKSDKYFTGFHADYVYKSVPELKK